MLSHEAIWKAIDGLASRNNLSPSALARRSGLDPTSFNPSKRVKADGRLRWPSTESIAKILDATNTEIDDFLAPILTGRKRTTGAGGWSTQAILAQKIPQQWPRIDARPTQSNKSSRRKKPVLFVMEVVGDQFYPLYRNGDILLLANDLSYSPGDRVIVKDQNNDLVAGELSQMRTRSISLHTDLEQNRVQTFALDSVEWVARIVWVSQ